MLGAECWILCTLPAVIGTFEDSQRIAISHGDHGHQSTIQPRGACLAHGRVRISIRSASAREGVIFLKEAPNRKPMYCHTANSADTQLQLAY